MGVVHAGTQPGWGDGALLATGEATGTGVTDIDHRCVHLPEGGHGAAADRHRGPAEVFATLDGPSPAELGALGATRVTFGPGLLRRATEALRGIAGGIGQGA